MNLQITSPRRQSWDQLPLLPPTNPLGSPTPRCPTSPTKTFSTRWRFPHHQTKVTLTTMPPMTSLTLWANRTCRLASNQSFRCLSSHHPPGSKHAALVVQPHPRSTVSGQEGV